MKGKKRRARRPEVAARSPMPLPLDPKQEEQAIILRMAEESGEKSMKAVGKRLERGIRAALNSGKSGV